jgi:putative spermidine/putrescine transport system permease protein
MAQMQAEAAALPATPRPHRLSFAFLGVVPFFIFAVMFLLWPTAFLIIGGFQDSEGHFTLGNIWRLFEPTTLNAFKISIEISIASALIGAIFGFFLAASVVLGGLPRWLRPTLMTFCGVASNFAGLPLAFAFIATLGRTGLVTAL